MKNIQRFDEFNSNLNEGLKDWVAAALLLFSTPSMANTGGDVEKDSRTKINNKQYLSTVHKSFNSNDVKSQEEVKQLIKQGWRKDAESIDTIYNELSRTNPDTSVMCVSAMGDSSSFFNLGSYEISDTSKTYIESVVRSILDMNGMIVKVEIISSTDKTELKSSLKNRLSDGGYEPSNAGLSKARSESIKRILTNGELQINPELISTKNLVEMGSKYDNKNRYVIVNFKYIVPPKYETRVNVKLSKVFNTKYYKVPKHTKIGNVRTHDRMDECPQVYN